MMINTLIKEGMIFLGYKSRYHDWLVSDYFDEDTKAELESIKDDEEEIEDRFYKDLDFGTGGMRGKMGAGTNRMNIYTIRKATQGLANYIINYDKKDSNQSVVIAYDCRHHSAEFAREAALVLAANGIKAFLFDELRATPILSFAVRELNTVAGIVITASHNPPEYNGYKVYGEDGGQVVPEKARKIIAEIDEVDDLSLVKRMDKEEAEENDLLEIVGSEIDNRYQEEMKKVLPDKELARQEGKDLAIIYTPLHGTAYKPVTSVLSDLGFDNLSIIEEQAEPDPDFSTVTSPNPEEITAFNLALEEAEKTKPDLIMGTDPDGDRMGVVVRNLEGNFVGLTGNQVGVLLVDYLLNRKDIPENGVIIKTIVTTEMVKEIAAKYDIEVMDVLTGFKYIGEKIKEFKEKGDKSFVFGFEESYGYLVGTYARDKDAVVACALTAIMALYYKKQGISIYERLEQLRDEYGYYLEGLESIRLEGKEGQETIARTLAALRQEKSRELSDKKVICLKDYLEGQNYNFENDEDKEIDLPQSNVLQYLLEDKTLITVRPSGTEPKLKIYFAVRGENKKEAEAKLETVTEDVLHKINEMVAQV